MKVISSKTHVVIGLITALALLVAPNLFGFSDNETASAIARLVGVVILINELITTSAYSPFKLVPMRIHVVIDYVTGAFLALSPWLFGFAEDSTNDWLPHLLVGLFVIAYAAMTRTDDESTKSIAE